MKKLIIGNKNYSSWSLRPWILMKDKAIDFEELIVYLYKQESKLELLKHSRSGKVPVLLDEGLSIWDSLAICEYIAECYPEKNCWPEDIKRRAIARSISHEMHSGFFVLRNTLHMNCRKSMVFSPISSELQGEINRICEIWTMCREECASQGDYLFGEFSIADAMYAPVVLRFNSYGIKVGAVEQQYMETILQHPFMREWINAGVKETEIIQASEVE